MFFSGVPGRLQLLLLNALLGLPVGSLLLEHAPLLLQLLVLSLQVLLHLLVTPLKLRGDTADGTDDGISTRVARGQTMPAADWQRGPKPHHRTADSVRGSAALSP